MFVFSIWKLVTSRVSIWYFFFFKFFFLFCFKFIYFERERKRAQAGQGLERGRQRIPSRLRAVRTGPKAGLDLTNHESMTWTEIKSQMLNQLSHPDSPTYLVLLKMCLYHPILALDHLYALSLDYLKASFRWCYYFKSLEYQVLCSKGLSFLSWRPPQIFLGSLSGCLGGYISSTCSALLSLYWVCNFEHKFAGITSMVNDVQH